MGLEHLHAIVLPTPFPVGPVTVYLADALGEPLTLVDTGPCTHEARAALEVELHRLGHSGIDLDRILVTHAHADHFGLAADLVVASGARLFTHRWNLSALQEYDGDRERRSAFYAGLMRQAGAPGYVAAAMEQATEGVQRFGRPVAVDTPLDEGDQVRLAGLDWQVLHTPGHATGLVCLYEPSSRTMLSSDHLLADISSNPVVEPPPPGHTERPRSLVLYMASLHRIAAMAIDRALPSHGPPIHDVAELVEKRLAFHQRRLARVTDALHDGARTTWDITCALFPNRLPLDTFLALSEVLGHLDVLAMSGQISGELRDEVVLWSLTGG